jgi:predicted PurR-regulated permease PerM
MSEPLTTVEDPATKTNPTDISDLTAKGGPLSANPQLVVLTCLLILACLTIAYVASDIILPFVLALVLKLLFQPAMRLLERIRIPKTLCALILIVAFFAVIVAIGAAVSGPATSWAQRLPEALPRLQQRLDFLSQPIMTAQRFLQQIGGDRSAGFGIEIFSTLFNRTRDFAGGLFETFLILFFLLVSGDTFLRKFVEILPRFREKREVVELSQQVERNISAYLVTITAMNTLVGIATGIAMWATGVGDPMLWGVVALILNYVPIIGPFAGVAVFVLAGMLSIDGTWAAFLPAAIYLGIHMIEGEMITPMLLARRFTLNPVLVIVSLIFWFWMWGAVGAVLAVPLLAIFKLLCDGIESLNGIGHFLEG